MLRLPLIAAAAGIFSLTALPLPASAYTQDPIFSAWIPTWDKTRGEASFFAHVDSFDEISPFWYALSEEGVLTTDEGADDVAFIRRAQEAGVRVIPSVRNGYLGRRFTTMVRDPEKRAKHIADIVAKVERLGLDGIDLDYEAIALADKEAFELFVTDLAKEMHARNRILAIDVQAKWSSPGLWDTQKSQDWPVLSAVVDRFRIMSYDEHYSGGEPGPIASAPWMTKIANYALAQVPHEKVIMGLPFYGYEWTKPRERVWSITWVGVQEELAKHGVSTGWDDINKEPYYAFFAPSINDPAVQVEHIVWFNDARSIREKMLLFTEKEVAGLTAWRLGNEDPGVYDAIDEMKRLAPVPERFADVPTDSLAQAAIEDLHRRGVVSGQDGNFHPDNSVSRAEAVKMALRHLRFTELLYDPRPVSDVAAGDWPHPFVQTALVRRIVSGYEDGSFQPWKNITRAEALKIILRARSIREGGTERFEDVPSDGWYAPYVAKAAALNIVRGKDDGLFHPDDPVTRAEFVAMLTR